MMVREYNLCHYGTVLLRSMLAGLFIYAGTTKVLDPQQFLDSVLSFHLVNYPIALAVIWYLPWLEILCGAMLLFSWGRSASSRILIVLMACFILVLSVSWARGLDVTCGCFGGKGKTSYPWGLFRNSLILAGLVIVSRPIVGKTGTTS